jgi:hypothetical protein
MMSRKFNTDKEKGGKIGKKYHLKTSKIVLEDTKEKLLKKIKDGLDGSNIKYNMYTLESNFLQPPNYSILLLIFRGFQ